MSESLVINRCDLLHCFGTTGVWDTWSLNSVTIQKHEYVKYGGD